MAFTIVLSIHGRPGSVTAPAGARTSFRPPRFRTSVTDPDWDYLPALGYAVRDPDSKSFVFHARRDGVLHRLDRERAVGLGLVGADGLLMPHGQPVISECRSVHPYGAGYAEADCTFDDWRQEKLLITVAEGALPKPRWFVGKKSMQVERFPSPQHPAQSAPS